jgi:aspartyl-tRNA(Asn)/glutamyl-tRNA(Gln) amidotransferase subunit A
MSDITSQSLTSLVKNIKEKKLSSEEVTKLLLIVLKNQKN